MDSLLVISDVPPTLTLCKWYYLDDIIEHGIDVVFWNVGPLVYPGVPADTVGKATLPQKIFTEEKEFLRALEDIDAKKTLCFIYIGYGPNGYFVFKAVREKGFITATQAFDPIPPIIKPPAPNLLPRLKKVATHPLTVLRNRSRWLAEKFCTDVQTQSEPHPEFCRLDYVFSSSAATPLPPYADEATKIIRCSSVSYEEALKEKDLQPNPEGDGACVFLDQSFPYNPDLACYAPERLLTPTEAENYLKTMRLFFDAIEQQLHMRVVIAAHPKSNYTGGEFGDRPVIKGQTSGLVRWAALVVVHQSTSFMSALCYKKPLLFVTTDQMQKKTLCPWLAQAYANAVDAPFYHAEAIPARLTIPKINKKRYRDLLLAYSTWQELEGIPAGPLVACAVKNI
jgi:hypothetical protein